MKAERSQLIPRTLRGNLVHLTDWEIFAQKDNHKNTCK